MAAPAVVLLEWWWHDNQLSCGVVAVRLVGVSQLFLQGTLLLYLVPSVASPPPFSSVKTILIFPGPCANVHSLRRADQQRQDALSG